MIDPIPSPSVQQSQYYTMTTEEIGRRTTAELMEKNAAAVASGEMPALNVILSPESLEAAAKHNAEAFVKKMDGTAANGLSVSVERSGAVYAAETDALESYLYRASFTDSAGNTHSVDFTADIRAGLSSDGSLSVFFSELNKTRTYVADGSYTEADGDLLDPDADSIYVTTGNSTVNGGNGNNLFFLYGDNNTVNGGSGNDDVRIAAGVSGAIFNTGGGNDKVSGYRLRRRQQHLGSGLIN